MARSRTLATRLVREGRVTVNRVVVTKPAMKVSTAPDWHVPAPLPHA
ncbi:S4 domain-containing protein [Cutibacterium acnes]